MLGAWRQKPKTPWQFEDDAKMMQIGICGTFDVQNYGDLLFPLIAEAELSRRLGPISLQRFSYFDKAPPDWPYRVTSVAELPKIASRLDGMIIGGGHLIRFDKDVAFGYHPPNPGIHHPTGYWLSPALICLHHGCPVVWGAPGAVGNVPAWAQPLMHLAIGLSRYVAVRDGHAQATIAPFASGQDINLVPDTCFGVARILDRKRRPEALAKLHRSLKVTRPYILVQATRGLKAFARLLAKASHAFRRLSACCIADRSCHRGRRRDSQKRLFQSGGVARLSPPSACRRTYRRSRRRRWRQPSSRHYRNRTGGAGFPASLRIRGKILGIDRVHERPCL